MPKLEELSEEEARRYRDRDSGGGLVPVEDSQEMARYASKLSSDAERMKSESKDPITFGRVLPENIVPEDTWGSNFANRAVDITNSLLEGARDAAIHAPNAIGLELADEALGVINPEWGETYERLDRGARENSPVFTTAADLLSPSPVSKVMRGVKGVKKLGGLSRNLIEGGATGAALEAGQSGEVTPEGVASGAAFSAGLGAAGRGIKSGFRYFGDSRVNRLKSMGIGAQDVQNFDLKSRGKPEEHMKKLADTFGEKGLFDAGKDTYNLRTGKFEGAGTLGEKAERVVIPPSPKQLRERLEDGITKIGKELDESFKKGFADEAALETHSYSPGQIKSWAKNFTNRIKKELPEDITPTSRRITKSKTSAKEKEIAKEFGNFLAANTRPPNSNPRLRNRKELQDLPEFENLRHSGRPGFEKQYEESMKNIFGDPKDYTVTVGGRKFTYEGNDADITRINDEKKRLYRELRSPNAINNMSADKNQAMKEMAKGLAKVVEDMIPEGERANYKRLNKQYGEFADLFPAAKGKQVKDLSNPAAVHDLPIYGSGAYQAAQGGVAGLSRGLQSQLVHSAEGGSPTFQRFLENLQVEALPRAITPNTPQADREGRSPDSLGGDMEEDPMSFQSLMGERSPDAMPLDDPMSGNPFIENINTLQDVKIPRDFAGFLENKEILEDKIAVEYPELYPMIQEAMSKPTGELEEMLPGLIEEFPDVFEHDKYGRIDGIIIDPMMQEKARRDISNDDNLSLGQKAKMISKLNKQGKLEGY